MNPIETYIKSLITQVDSDILAEILRKVSTADLQAELSRREGVKVIGLNHDSYAEVTLKGVAMFGFDAPVERVTITGPALLTVNVD